jgi:hypothetical protein
MSRPFRISRATSLSLAGLAVGIVGLLVQWAADPGKFGGVHKTFGMAFPPGILFIAACGVLVVLTRRWWWHPVFAVLIAFWIVVMGSVADQLQPNLVSSNPGTVAGNVVMALGLVSSGVAGVYGMVTGVRARRRRLA